MVPPQVEMAPEPRGVPVNAGRLEGHGEELGRPAEQRGRFPATVSFPASPETAMAVPLSDARLPDGLHVDVLDWVGQTSRLKSGPNGSSGTRRAAKPGAWPINWRPTGAKPGDVHGVELLSAGSREQEGRRRGFVMLDDHCGPGLARCPRHSSDGGKSARPFCRNDGRVLQKP